MHVRSRTRFRRCKSVCRMSFNHSPDTKNNNRTFSTNRFISMRKEFHSSSRSSANPFLAAKCLLWIRSHWVTMLSATPQLPTETFSFYQKTEINYHFFVCRTTKIARSPDLIAFWTLLFMSIAQQCLKINNPFSVRLVGHCVNSTLPQPDLCRHLQQGLENQKSRVWRRLLTTILFSLAIATASFNSGLSKRRICCRHFTWTATTTTTPLTASLCLEIASIFLQRHATNVTFIGSASTLDRP